jgi:hypothetical protein
MGFPLPLDTSEFVDLERVALVLPLLYLRGTTPSSSLASESDMMEFVMISKAEFCCLWTN